MPQEQHEIPALAEDEEILQVILPESATRPGSRLTVSTPDGRLYEITVPTGLSEGDTINVVVKKASAGTPPVVNATLHTEADGEGGEGTGRSSAIAGMDDEQGRDNASTDGNVSREPTDPNSPRALLGVAGAGALVGTVVIGGLITGPVIVGGAALYASQKSGRIGKIVKESGAKIADAASFTYRAAKKAGSVTMTKAKEFDEKYDMSGKAEKAGTVALDTAVKVGSTMRRWSIGAFNFAKDVVARPAAGAGDAATAESAAPVAQGRVVGSDNSDVAAGNTVFTAVDASAVNSTHTDANAAPQVAIAEVDTTATAASTSAAAGPGSISKF